MNNENCIANDQCPHDCSPIHAPCWHHREMIEEAARWKADWKMQFNDWQALYDKFEELKRNVTDPENQPNQYCPVNDCLEVIEFKRQIEVLKCCGNCEHFDSTVRLDEIYEFCDLIKTKGGFFDGKNEKRRNDKCDKWEATPCNN